MMAFGVVVLHRLCDHVAEVFLAEEDVLAQSFACRSHEALGVGVQVRRLRRQPLAHNATASEVFDHLLLVPGYQAHLDHQIGLNGSVDRAPTPQRAAASPHAISDCWLSPRLCGRYAVEELQQVYTEVVGRDTGSSDRRYLIWKIREAKKGRIKTGPVRRRYADGEAPDMKVLPLRMEAEIVARLDEARERLGLKTRMDLFRKSLADYLTAAGEHEVAQLLTEQA